MNLILSPLVYALLGLLTILPTLLSSGHAKMHPIDPGSGYAGCPDERVIKDILVFGGSSAYTFGWPYFLAAWYFGDPWGILRVYGITQLVLSGIQTLTLLAQVSKSHLKTFPLKAHFDCGYDAAWNVIWPVFWFQRVRWLGWLGAIRVVFTLIDYIASLPATIVISLISKALFGKWIQPVITKLDYP